MLTIYHESLQEYLSPDQILMLEMLVRVIQIFKEVKIEKLAARLPLPIKYESRRRAVQRFLINRGLDISLIWLPIVKMIIDKIQSNAKNKARTKKGSKQVLHLAIDRTQWADNNVFVVAAILNKRAMPIYWIMLDKKGCSNLSEQQQLIRPALALLSNYQMILLGDREFRGVHLAAWLTQLKVKYVFRIKGDTCLGDNCGNVCLVNQLKIKSGVRYFYPGIKLTKYKGFGYNNLAIYWKRKYRGKQPKEPWYLVTNLDSADAAISAYQHRMGIEMMFRDCKTGGYNLEGSKANSARLTNLILLIAIAYTQSTLDGIKYQSTLSSQYFGRSKKLRGNTSKTSRFWLGRYADDWLMMIDLMSESLGFIMLHRPQHRLNFLKGLSATTLVASS
jgi:hypothetical protein